MFIVLIIGEYIAFFSTSNSLYKVEISYQSLCFVYIGITECISWYNRHFLLSICSRIYGEEPVFENNNVVQRTESVFKLVIKIFSGIYFITIFVYILAPLINFARIRRYNEPIAYPLPYWFANFKINSLVEYVCMNMVQNILCTAVFFMYARSFAFVVCAIINCWTYTQELVLIIGKLGDVIKNESIDGGRLLNENYLINELKNIIKFQQNLSRYCSFI